MLFLYIATILLIVSFNVIVRVFDSGRFTGRSMAKLVFSLPIMCFSALFIMIYVSFIALNLIGYATN